jgi:hypothetical protein
VTSNGACDCDLDLIEETFNDLSDLVIRYEDRLVFKWSSPDARFALDTHRKLERAREALRRLRNA